jgi:LPXTG-motif cell wall-anchored protein
MLQLRIFLKLAVCMFILLTVSPLCFAEEQILSIEEVTRIDLGGEINCIAIDEKLNRIYVGVDNSLVVINGASKQVTKTVQIILEYYYGESWIIVDSLKNQLWVGCSDGCIYVIDGETYAIRKTPFSTGRFGFALDALRERVYIASSTHIQGEFDTIRIYNSTDFTSLGCMDVPGSNIPTTVTSFSILLDTELNRIYVDWRYTTFLLDCASGSQIWNHTSPSSFVGEHTQIYENKIYKTSGILDANTLQYIVEFGGYRADKIVDVDPHNSTVYRLHWNEVFEYGSDSAFSLLAMDGLTNKTLASSDDIIKSDDGVVGKLNWQTGEIYFGGDSGILYVFTLTSSPLPSTNEQDTSGTYVMITVVIITILVIAAIAIVLRRRKKHI